MLRGLYGAAISMQGSARQHEMIAKNLAHSQVPGYRRAQVVQGTFQNSLNETSEEFASRSSSGIRGIETIVDFSDGLLKTTARALDVAIQGEGFFVVGDDAEPLYTRNGSFVLDENGRLTTRDGRVVQGKNGAIQVQENDGSSQIAIDSSGRLSLNDTEIGQLKVVRFQDRSKLVNVGTTLFQDPDLTAQPLEEVQISAGQLELSNVQPVTELVDLITVQRRYDAAARTMKLLMRTLEQRINLQKGS